MSIVTLEQVEAQIAHRFALLRFEPEIELLFRQDYVAERNRLIGIWAVIGLFIYDLVYFGDRAMIPDVLTEVTALRLLVFTPAVIACALVVRRWPSSRLYDALSVLVAVLGVSLPMAAAVGSQSSYLLIYQNYNAAAFLFFVIALRPLFPAMLAGLVLMCVSHLSAAYLTGAFDAVTFGGIVTFYLMLSIFLAAAAYFLERTDRRNFLNQLRAALLYRQLEVNSERDELTGLLNRRSLARIGRESWSAEAETPVVSAILLDIDHFKRFNDLYGHIDGDACIRTVSQHICATVGKANCVFRFGGEEILVLLPGQTSLQALATAEKIRRAVEGLAIPHGKSDHGVVTASLGVASAMPAQMAIEKLLQRADEALYEAKHRGRNTVVIAEEPQIAA
ncbi:GGDEF domain-containing protein [Aliirhizobium cellulosilyticum]|jgi:diguanylate cyclase (GGDEF)-like protein|uniref:diguanylate cyclase n=1 Tax=Aliirhizobium cellulosilyticum TaxID=393664 RepID=A0A7W6V2G6_9HYPH|nr:diguanylate cyclase [Rhizobium cellulosilyticum]MBB4350870.1 diguanylate cyclase (GGDEF)-like protein [Rhizobium cellulosilyticum]MBB4414143.1 diguanylate cyclase (GGDEF)-like protein [Rhizobium cellulosilyticum]MBB4448758.1 diguanylate cyclase (GGDEF)-like protein [Rhizobium cellulosilyticum]